MDLGENCVRFCNPDTVLLGIVGELLLEPAKLLLNDKFRSMLALELLVVCGRSEKKKM